MLRATARAFHASAVRAATPAAAAATGPLPELTLSLALPHRSLVAKKEVARVTVPGRDGALGIEKNSPPLLTELKPGVIRVDYKDNTSEEFFVPVRARPGERAAPREPAARSRPSLPSPPPPGRLCVQAREQHHGRVGARGRKARAH